MNGSLPLLAYARLTGRRLLRLIGSRPPWRTIERPSWWRMTTTTVVGFATVYLDIVSVRFGQRAWVEDLAVAPTPSLQRDRKGVARCGQSLGS